MNHEEILYKKVKNRYVPHKRDYDRLAFPKGTHILVIGEGMHSYIYNVPNDKVIRLALLAPIKDKLVDALAKRLEYRPTVKLTEKQLQTWDKLKKDLGVEMLTSASLEEAVRDVLDELAEEKA
jgi:hypothetical protein